MHAVPNGGNRNPREAARLVGQGVKPGVSDIFLPLARGGHHGLYIEMKRQKKHGPSRVSKDQASFQYAMIDEGYQAVVCYGAGEAITAIKNYCGL